jgi:SnoaL-like protein
MNEGSVSAQDYVDIQNLYARYNLTSDAGDPEGYAACFTDDGVLQIDPLGVKVQGRASFVTFKQKDAAGRGSRYRRHWNGSLHLEKLDADTVRGRCYFHGYNGKPGELPVFADAGVYDDRIVRTGGGWRFARRHITMDASSWTAPRT